MMTELEYRERINEAVARAYAMGHANGALGVGTSSPIEVVFAFQRYWTDLIFTAGEMLQTVSHG